MNDPESESDTEIDKCQVLLTWKSGRKKIYGSG